MNNKVAIVTGASRGIGKEIALTLAENGYDLAIACHHNAAGLEQVRTFANEHGGRCITFCGDLASPSKNRQFFSRIFEVYPTIDVLVNNAGISHIGLLQDMTDEQWEQMLHTNLSLAFYCTRQVLPPMIKQQHGKIINISSVWGNVGASMEVAYATTKGGLNAFTKALAKETGPSNIQVNAIAAGFIDTDMNQHLTPEEKTALCEEIPVNRAGTPKEVAQMVQKIIESPDYLTGQIITLDGGWM